MVERAGNIAIHKVPTRGALVQRSGKTVILQKFTRRVFVIQVEREKMERFLPRLHVTTIQEGIGLVIKYEPASRELPTYPQLTSIVTKKIASIQVLNTGKSSLQRMMCHSNARQDLVTNGLY